MAHNDIIVMGSDGIFDNLVEHHVMNCINPHLKARSRDLASAQAVADCLSASAEFLGYDPAYNSPFAVEAAQQGKDYPGGKADDITVIVAQVKIE